MNGSQLRAGPLAELLDHVREHVNTNRLIPYAFENEFCRSRRRILSVESGFNHGGWRKVRRVLILLLLACLFPAAARAEQNKKPTVALKWNAPVAGTGGTVDGYNIYRSEKENGHYELIAKRVSASTYIDTAVQSGHTYYYRVTSIDAKGRESTAATTKATVP